MIKKFSRLRALSWPERQVVLEAMLLLPLFWGALWVIGFSRLHAWVARRPLAGSDPRAGIAPDTIGALIRGAGNHIPFRSTCLTRSLLLVWLLRRRGVRSELRIGVRQIDGGIDSHAWVELDGRPVNEARGVRQRFAVFDQTLSPKVGASR